MSPKRLAVVGVAVAWATLAAGAAPLQRGSSASQPKVNPTAAAIKSFLDRVNKYVAVQKQLESGLPRLSPSDQTTRIEHEKALAERIQQARADAKQGDIFGDAAPVIKNIIVEDLKKRNARDVLAVTEEVPSQRSPAVNATYPENAALATVPPLILVNLPTLPDGLEYRFMGRDLILRDRTSNLIVDFIPGAIPVRK